MYVCAGSLYCPVIKEFYNNHNPHPTDFCTLQGTQGFTLHVVLVL
jgi:hypothetical protein